MLDGPGSLVERTINRFPEQLRPHLHETSDRLLGIRSPKQALQAFESEYEHLLRAAVVPVAIHQPILRHRTVASAFVASCAATAAVEEADVLLGLASGGTLAAPGTGVVVTVGMLSTVAEAYAAGSVRVHQLRKHDHHVDAGALASDIRQAQLGDLAGSTGVRGFVASAFERGAARLSTRWAVGAVPLVGIGLRLLRRDAHIRDVLRLPFDQ